MAQWINLRRCEALGISRSKLLYNYQTIFNGWVVLSGVKNIVVILNEDLSDINPAVSVHNVQ
jgi:hypothetical protein